jgi:hypothetical protein
MAAKRTSGGTSWGRQGRTLARPFASAEAAQHASARSFTSTAHTVAPGERAAMAQAIAPVPQPRSSRSAVAGTAGASSSR